MSFLQKYVFQTKKKKTNVKVFSMITNKNGNTTMAAKHISCANKNGNTIKQ